VTQESSRSALATQKEKANLISQTGLYLCRQRPQFILSLSKGPTHTWRVQYHRPSGALASVPPALTFDTDNPPL
jgi:hypothetical protein